MVGTSINLISGMLFFIGVETKRRIVGGKNSLYFPLSHHTYIYKKVRLY